MHITPWEKEISNRAQKDLTGAKGQFIISPIIYFPQGFLHSVLSTRNFANPRFSSFEMVKINSLLIFSEEICVEGKAGVKQNQKHYKHILSALINNSFLINSSLVKRSHPIHLPLKNLVM